MLMTNARIGEGVVVIGFPDADILNKTYFSLAT